MPTMQADRERRIAALWAQLVQISGEKLVTAIDRLRHEHVGVEREAYALGFGSGYSAGQDAAQTAGYEAGRCEGRADAAHAALKLMQTLMPDYLDLAADAARWRSHIAHREAAMRITREADTIFKQLDCDLSDGKARAH